MIFIWLVLSSIVAGHPPPIIIFPLGICFIVIERSACCIKMGINILTFSVTFICNGSAIVGILKSRNFANLPLPAPAAIIIVWQWYSLKSVLTKYSLLLNSIWFTTSHCIILTPLLWQASCNLLFATSGLSFPSWAQNSAPTIFLLKKG